MERVLNQTLRVIRNTAAFIGGEFFYRLVNFLACIPIARTLGGEGYGQFSLIYVYLSFFEVFVQFGLNSILVRELSQSTQNAARILGNALILRSLLVLAAVPVAMIGIGFLGYPLTVEQGVMLASFQLFLTLRPVFEAVFRVRLEMIYPALFNGMRALVNLLLVLVVAAWKPTMAFFILAYLGSGFLGMIALAFYSRRLIAFDFRFDRVITGNLMRQSAPLVISAYLTLLYYRIDVFMLSFMKTFQDVGYYSVAAKVSESLTMISTAVMISLFPLIARAYQENRSEFERLIALGFRWLLLAGLPLALGGILVARDFMVLFFGREFSPSGTTFMILLWYSFFCFIGSLLSNVLIACRKQKVDMWISFFLVCFNIFLNLILIPAFSYNGAATATVLTEVIATIVYFVYAFHSTDIAMKFPSYEIGTALKINLCFFLPLWLLQVALPIPSIGIVLVGIFFYTGLLFIFRLVSWEIVKRYFSSWKTESQIGVVHGH